MKRPERLSCRFTMYNDCPCAHWCEATNTSECLSIPMNKCQDILDNYYMISQYFNFTKKETTNNDEKQNKEDDNAEMTVNKIEQHKDICTKLHDTYKKKNSDYGDSFGISYRKYGIISAITRMSDKWNRLESLILSKDKPLVNDESISDTLLDLANYAIMTYMEIENGKKEETASN